MTSVPLNENKIERSGPKGYHEGGEPLPTTIKEFIARDKVLSEMGAVIGFSRWDDVYAQEYYGYKLGHRKFESYCLPCGCAGPGCCLAWLLFCPLALLYAISNMDNAEKDAVGSAEREGEGYHILFERHYVWMLDADEPHRSEPKVHKICFLPGIDEAKKIDNIDGHMRDGLLGGCQDSMIPPLPGMLFKGQAVDGETFNSWQREVVRTRHGGTHLQGQWEKAESKWQRRMVCDASKFSEALRVQKVKAEMGQPVQMGQMEMS